jgi:hypothetical protein
VFPDTNEETEDEEDQMETDEDVQDGTRKYHLMLMRTIYIPLIPTSNHTQKSKDTYWKFQETFHMILLYCFSIALSCSSLAQDLCGFQGCEAF